MCFLEGGFAPLRTRDWGFSYYPARACTVHSPGVPESRLPRTKGAVCLGGLPIGSVACSVVAIGRTHALTTSRARALFAVTQASRGGGGSGGGGGGQEVCPHCRSSFPSLADLIAHVEVVHTDTAAASALYPVHRGHYEGSGGGSSGRAGAAPGSAAGACLVSAHQGTRCVCDASVYWSRTQSVPCMPTPHTHTHSHTHTHTLSLSQTHTRIYCHTHARNCRPFTPHPHCATDVLLPRHLILQAALRSAPTATSGSPT
jgi:hypothetical protein